MFSDHAKNLYRTRKRICGQRMALKTTQIERTYFLHRNYTPIFFSTPKKNRIFFSELRNFLGYSFDVKNYVLSIYDVFRAIRCPQMRFLAL